jgi:hypothetical protein
VLWTFSPLPARARRRAATRDPFPLSRALLVATEPTDVAHHPLAVVVQVGYAVLASNLRIEERELEAGGLN